jgi:hypothetical protein
MIGGLDRRSLAKALAGRDRIIHARQLPNRRVRGFG